MRTKGLQQPAPEERQRGRDKAIFAREQVSGYGCEDGKHMFSVRWRPYSAPLITAIGGGMRMRNCLGDKRR